MTDNTTSNSQATLFGQSDDDTPSSADGTSGTEAESTDRSNSHEVATDQVTVHEADALSDWQQSHEQADNCYAYYHLQLQEYNDLTTRERKLTVNEKVSHASTTETARTTPKWGISHPDPEEVVEQMVAWKLHRLSTPLHPTARPTPNAHIRVFVASGAKNYLGELGVDIDSALQTLQQLSEHEPSEEYLSALTKYRTLKKETAYDGPLENKKKAIEQTIRAKFRLTGRGARADVPEPAEEYEDLDPNALRDALEAVRAELEEKRNAKDAARATYEALESDWLAETKEEFFPELTD